MEVSTSDSNCALAFCHMVVPAHAANWNSRAARAMHVVMGAAAVCSLCERGCGLPKMVRGPLLLLNHPIHAAISLPSTFVMVDIFNLSGLSPPADYLAVKFDHANINLACSHLGLPLPSRPATLLLHENIITKRNHHHKS